MKTNRFLSTASLLLAMALILSCSALEDALEKVKDEKDQILGAFTSGYLQNSNLNLVSGSIADVEGGEQIITSVDINGSALNGGSTTMTITSTKKLDKLLFEIDGEDGYYEYPLTDDNWINKDEGSATEYIYWVALEFAQDLGEDDDLHFTVSGITSSGAVSAPVEETVEVKEAFNGALQISVTWDQPVDVDLHVKPPTINEIYYSNRRQTIANGGDGLGALDIDSNPGCNLDNINSENVFFEKTPLEEGNYVIKVRLYSACGSSGKVRYHVTANSNGSFIDLGSKQTGTLDRTGDEVIVATLKVQNGNITVQ